MHQSPIPNLLLVDDDVDFADAQAEFLTAHGFKVRSAYDLASAEASISQFTPQLALIDIRLGNESGIQLLHMLQESVPGVVCIFMTGYAEVETAIDALRGGAVDYLRKPVAPEDLLAVLERNLERLRLLKEQEELRLIRRQDERAKATMQEEIELRQGIEEELRAHKDNLEQMVEERTRALQLTQERLNQSNKMEALGTLAGGIAHDFNNILTGITGFASLAKSKSADNPEVGKYLEEVLAAAQRAAELVAQILTFSRKSKIDKAVIDIEEVTREALGLLRQTIPSRIEMQTQFQVSRTNVLADPTEMHQLLMNLCTNAAGAIGEGAGTIRVTLDEYTCDEGLELGDTVLTPGSYLRLSVEDDGCGLGPETRKRIFDPFFTTAEVGEGTGMGLAMAHSIVTGSGGGIGVTSTPGSGARFDIYLPLTDQEAAIQSEAEQRSSAGVGRILVVDDEEMLLRLYEDMLAVAGYEVVLCNSSIEALAIYRENPDGYGLVITDQTMPQMTGSDLSRAIHQIRADQPILLCSGHADMFGDDISADLGVSACLVKPVMLDTLLAEVQRLLAPPEG